MAQFNFKAVTRPVDMADYAPEYTGAIFQVWVNMPRGVLGELYQIQMDRSAFGEHEPLEKHEAINARVYAWFSRVWSQSADKTTHITPDETEQLIKQLVDTDPNAWPWLSMRCQQVIEDYRTVERKN